jgi:hypothetical protein
MRSEPRKSPRSQIEDKSFTIKQMEVETHVTTVVRVSHHHTSQQRSSSRKINGSGFISLF